MSTPFDLGYQNPVATVQINTGFVGAAQAQAAAISTAADRAATAADRVQTGLDRTQTDADAAATAADRVQTGLDRTQTGADRVQTGNDAATTAANAASTHADATATAADRVQTGLDRTQTGADRAKTDADAAATAADRVQTGLDRQQTGADRVQTGLDRVQTDADVATTVSNAASSNAAQSAAAVSALTATAQAALAATYASSAASVAQQDLSGVTAGALHRSPNAIQSLFVYDTSRDSDGGAWVDHCQSQSWLSEALVGTWLYGPYSGFGGEMDARDWFGINQSPTTGSLITGDSSSFASSVGGWTSTATAGGTVSAVNGRMRLTQTGALGTTASANLSVTTVVGQRYRIDVSLVTPNPSVNAFVSAGTVAAGATLGQTNMGSTYGSKTLSFVATGTTTWINISGSTAWPTNSYAEFDNITCTPVNFASSPSGAYYQDNTNGTFRRLWKNRFGNPSNFNGSAWGKTNITVTTKADGLGDLIVPTTTSGLHEVHQTISIVGTVNSMTVRAKAGGFSWLGIQIGSNGNAYFDLVNGVTGTVTFGFTASITPVSGMAGYYDCIVTGTVNANQNAFAFICNGNGSTSFAGDGTSGVYIAQAQHELGSPTTYEDKSTSDQGTTAVYRGNSAKFPRIAGIVVEGLVVVIYDLTQPGRPMWMVFTGSGTGTMLAPGGGYNFGIVYCLNGKLAAPMAGGASVGLQVVDFIADKAVTHCPGSVYNGVYPAPISQRNLTVVSRNAGGPMTGASIANGTVYDVSLCVMPDAPIDPATGIQIPTIAAATGSGVSIIKHDGTVVTGPSAQISYVDITPNYVAYKATSSGIFYALQPGTLGANWVAAGTLAQGSAPMFVGDPSRFSTVQVSRFGTRGQWLVNQPPVTATDRVGGLRLNETNPAASLAFGIEGYGNSGWMVGDIRRVWLSDAVAGSVVSGELVTNGTFDTDTTGWSSSSSFSSTAQVVNGEMQVTTTATFGRQLQAINVIPGHSYVLTATMRVISGGTYAMAGISNSTNGASISGVARLSTTSTTPVTQSVSFTATQSTLYVVLGDDSNEAAGCVMGFDNVSVQEWVLDRSYKVQPLSVLGSIARSMVGGLAMASGFSATNYLQQAYSSDLDFGTGSWRISSWINIPTSLAWNNISDANFPVVGSEMLSMASLAAMSAGTTMSASGGSEVATRASSSGNFGLYQAMTTAATGSRSFKISISWSNNTSNLPLYCDMGGKTAFTIGTAVSGTITGYVTALSGSGNFYVYATGGAVGNSFQVDAVSMKEVAAAAIFERSSSSGGPSIRAGVTPTGYLTVFANDGTTTRIAVSASAYNTAVNLKASFEYTTDGTLRVGVNGVSVGTSTGTPLLTLSNASAVASVGNARTADSAFPGSIALVKVGATVPTLEQKAFMYQQEQAMFQSGAVCTLADTGNVVDMDYDATQDKWKFVSSANESTFQGLVRVATAATPAGALTHTSHRSNIKLLSRITTNAGVDVTVPSQSLMAELANRDRASAERARLEEVFDYTGGFNATQQLGTNATSLANWTYPGSVNMRGAMLASGTGLPANTTITDIVGTTLYVSQPFTQAGAATIALLDFPLPVGYEAKSVMVNGVFKQEGSTKDWTRLYDGFRETIRFAVAPGSTAWVQIKARRTK
jgi:hypothetical protein